ncbi:hypothetical protein PQQ87_23395 [Paraburkholderia nemoris]
MCPATLVTSNMRELDRSKIIEPVVQHRLTIVLSAERRNNQRVHR